MGVVLSRGERVVPSSGVVPSRGRVGGSAVQRGRGSAIQWGSAIRGAGWGVVLSRGEGVVPSGGRVGG